MSRLSVENLIFKAKEELRALLGKSIQPEDITVSIAPGRANLIGEHTDYNNGYVMPLAIDKHTVIVGTKLNEKKIFVKSLHFNEKKIFPLNDIKFKKEDKWVNYLKGILFFLTQEGYKFDHGAAVVIINDLPVNAGVSSSASLEVAFANFISKLYNFNLDKKTIAEISFKAEREFMNISCGIMDQYIITFAKTSTLLFLDTLEKKFEYINFPTNKAKIVLVDSRVKHEAKQVLNERRQECQNAVNILRKFDNAIKSLRDVTLEMFEKYKNKLPEKLRKRVEHIVFENQRVMQTVDVLKKGKLEDLSTILREGHESCKRLYEVSCYELDLLVDLAYDIEGTIGARLTGAGFGGNTINVVYSDSVNDFAKVISEKYKEKVGFTPGIIITDPVSGVV